MIDAYQKVNNLDTVIFVEMIAVLSISAPAWGGVFLYYNTR